MSGIAYIPSPGEVHAARVAYIARSRGIGHEEAAEVVARLYVSFGTPAGEYKSECRAAVVTAGPHFVPGTFSESGGEAVSLCVLNPEGMFFNKSVLYHEGDTGRDHAGDEVAERSYRGGSWHWPERAE